MELEKGLQYNHKSSGFVGEYSHSDESDHNHFFKPIKIPKEWGDKHTNKDGLVSFPTWDLQRNMELAAVKIIQGKEVDERPDIMLHYLEPHYTDSLTKDQKIKGILVTFFRDATEGDYLNALNKGIEEIKGLHAS